MDKKTAWVVLFANVDQATTALQREGVVDPGITLEKNISERVEEFLVDPAKFLRDNASDVRVPHWRKLAVALGTNINDQKTPTLSGVTPRSGQPYEPLSREDKARRQSIAADEAKRLADLRLAAEQRRLDEESAERRREADERAEDRKIKRQEEAAQRQREAKEAERKAKLAQEAAEEAARVEANKPRSLIDVTDRSIPPARKRVLESKPYLRWRDGFINAERSVREANRSSILTSLRMGDEPGGPQASFILDELLEALNRGDNLSRPDWFAAMFLTGADLPS